MRKIYETFTDEEFSELKKLKGDLSWHDFILRKDLKKKKPKRKKHSKQKTKTEKAKSPKEKTEMDKMKEESGMGDLW